MSTITRAEAKAADLPRYFTGLPCKHGHVAERSTVNGQCLECARIRGRNAYNKDVELSRKKAKEHRDQHPDQAEKKRLRRYEKEPGLAARQQLRAGELRARKEAIKRGETTYLSKRSCRKGHAGLRFTGDGKCVECNRISCQTRHDRKVNNNPELLGKRIKRIEAQKERALKRESAARRKVVRDSSGVNRRKAISDKATTFEGSPCRLCGGTTKFTSNAACIGCAHTRGTSEAKKQYDKKYVKENYDWIQAKQKQYRELNSVTIVEKAKLWAQRNPEKRKSISKSYKARRRTIEKDGDSTASVHDWERQALKLCHWCGVECGTNYHVDHVMPLSKGGKHEVKNLVIACPKCNLRKSAKDPKEFAGQMAQTKSRS